MTNVKTCTKCNEAKETTEFGKRASSKDGLFTQCRGCRAEEAKAYNAANRDARSAQSKVYYEANKLRFTINSKVWKKNNPDHFSAIQGKRGAVKRAPCCLPEDFDLHATIPLYAEARKLSADTGIPHEVDHIVPIAAGGLHKASNLQVLTAAENKAKGAKE